MNICNLQSREIKDISEDLYRKILLVKTEFEMYWKAEHREVTNVHCQSAQIFDLLKDMLLGKRLRNNCGACYHGSSFLSCLHENKAVHKYDLRSFDKILVDYQIFFGQHPFRIYNV